MTALWLITDMRMTLAAFALVLCFWTPNVPGKPQKGGNGETQVSPKQGPTTITVNNSHTNEEEQHPQPKPWNGYASPEGALVIVGIITFGGILYQARETAISAKAARDSVAEIKRQADIMERQTTATEIAANAADKNAKALINSERAWFIAYIDYGGRIWGDVIEDSEGNQDTWIYPKIIVKNKGKTPGWLMEIKYAAVVYGGAIPETPDVRLLKPDPLYHGTTPLANGDPFIYPFKVAYPGDHPKTMVLYGVVTYRDIFGENRTTWFGYLITPEFRLDRIPERREYNRCT
jgi:hypothetical protein